MRRYWTCSRCHNRNPRTNLKCLTEGCAGRRPKPRVPAHARTLRDDSYDVYEEVNAAIHASGHSGEWSPADCVECGESMGVETSTRNGQPCHIRCPRDYPGPVGDALRRLRDERLAASPSLREPTTAEIAETLLDYNECLAWAEQFKGTPFNMLAVATVAAKAAGPLLVMRSLFALAAENERLRGVLERIIAEDAQADWYYADIAREALKDAK